MEGCSGVRVRVTAEGGSNFGEALGVRNASGQSGVTISQPLQQGTLGGAGRAKALRAQNRCAWKGPALLTYGIARQLWTRNARVSVPFLLP